MPDNRLNSIERAARGEPIDPAYLRAPADDPPTAYASDPTWMAEVIVGTSEGLPYTYPNDGAGGLTGVYLNEVNRQTLQSFYPSRTRDNENDYITTIGQNLRMLDMGGMFDAQQWPIPFEVSGTFVQVETVIDALGQTVHRFDYPYVPVMAKVTAVNGGWPSNARWPQGGLTVVWPVFHLTTSWADGFALPYGKVDDFIPVTGAASPNAGGGYVMVVDMTARVPIKVSQAIPSPFQNASYVKIDPSNNILWTDDN